MSPGHRRTALQLGWCVASSMSFASLGNPLEKAIGNDFPNAAQGLFYECKDPAASQRSLARIVECRDDLFAISSAERLRVC